MLLQNFVIVRLRIRRFIFLQLTAETQPGAVARLEHMPYMAPLLCCINKV